MSTTSTATPPHGLRRVRSCPVIVTLVGLAGCGGARAGDHPRAVVDAYVAAINANRPDLAHALLAGKVKRTVSAKAFAAHWKRVRPELKRQAAELSRPPSKGRAPLEVVARYPYSLTLKLTQQSRLWGVDPGHLTAPAGDTPERTAMALADAIQRRDLPGLLSLYSARGRRDLDKTLDGRLRAIRKALANGFSISGKRAVLQYSRDQALVLVKEGNRWKIRSLE